MRGAVSVRGEAASSSYGSMSDAVRGKEPFKKHPPGVLPLAVSVASNLARQDEGINASVTQMNDVARRILTQSRGKEDTKRQTTRLMANDTLANPLTTTPPKM